MKISSIDNKYSHSIKNFQNISVKTSKITFSSLYDDKNSDDSFSQEYKMDRAQAAFSLILTYLIIGGVMLFLVKSCSADNNDEKQQSQIKIHQNFKK